MAWRTARKGASLRKAATQQPASTRFLPFRTFSVRCIRFSNARRRLFYAGRQSCLLVPCVSSLSFRASPDCFHRDDEESAFRISPGSDTLKLASRINHRFFLFARLLRDVFASPASHPRQACPAIHAKPASIRISSYSHAFCAMYSHCS